MIPGAHLGDKHDWLSRRVLARNPVVVCFLVVFLSFGLGEEEKEFVGWTDRLPLATLPDSLTNHFSPLNRNSQLRSCTHAIHHRPFNSLHFSLSFSHALKISRTSPTAQSLALLSSPPRHSHSHLLWSCLNFVRTLSTLSSSSSFSPTIPFLSFSLLCVPRCLTFVHASAKVKRDESKPQGNA